MEDACKKSVVAGEDLPAGAEQVNPGTIGHVILRGVEHFNDVGPVRPDESDAEPCAPVQVVMVDFGDGDVEAFAHFGNDGPDYRAFLLQGMDISQQQVQFNPTDPHIPMVPWPG